MTLTTDELLLGGTATHTVEIPPEVLRPADGDEPDGDGPAQVVLRPLLLADVQRIHQAAHESRDLTSVLMVQQALVEPKASVEEVNRMHTGLVEFLLHEVNRISGLALGGDELEEVVQAPLARACFVLAREFGWTPDECARLTVGQVLLYLELLGAGRGVMEQRDVLTGDPLRLDGAARGPAALRRLDAASARVEQLEDAARGIAALTRVRLTNLTSPARGDDALVDVLARLVPPAGAGDGAPDAPAPRRFGVPVSLPSTARVRRVAHDRWEATVLGAGRSAANGRPVRFGIPEAPASRRRMRATASEPQHARVLPQGAAVEAPTAPPGFEAAADVRGLEWLAVRMPGGVESSETLLVDGTPEVGWVRPAPSAAAAPATATRALPVPDQAAPVLLEFERTPETRRAVQPLPRTTGGDAWQRRLGGAQGLDALVRAWQDTQPPVSPEQAEPRDGPVAPVSGDRGFARTGAAARTRPADTRASEREEETLVFGDALARVLVGELRRYGIEVDAG